MVYLRENPLQVQRRTGQGQQCQDEFPEYGVPPHAPQCRPPVLLQGQVLGRVLPLSQLVLLELLGELGGQVRGPTQAQLGPHTPTTLELSCSWRVGLKRQAMSCSTPSLSGRLSATTASTAE